MTKADDFAVRAGSLYLKARGHHELDATPVIREGKAVLRISRAGEEVAILGTYAELEAFAAGLRAAKGGS